MTTIISTEGPDLLGKSTQIALLASELKRLGYKVATIKLPAYKTRVGRMIRMMLDNGKALRWPNIFQSLQWLDKFIFQTFELRSLIKKNDFILLDRWHASMWAYGLPGGANETLTNICIKTLREPDLILIFQGTRKQRIKEEIDSYELDKNLQKNVALHYILWACTHPDNTQIVEADGSIADVHFSVMTAVHTFKQEKQTNEVSFL